ncbi:MAG: nitroreductase/quinone reductase family protein [Pseudomonadota bacterium]
MSALPDALPDWIKEHLALYLRDGEAGHYWDASDAGGEGMLTTLLLFTTGRKSGKELVLPLIYRPAGDGSYCVIASKGGAPAHPAWYLNLVAQPEVKIKVVNDTMMAKARTAEGAERQALWETMAAYYPPYNDYQVSAGDREIPVVVLEPN